MLNTNVYKTLDMYETPCLDADKLIEILAKENIIVTKDEFEEILDNYYLGVGNDLQ